MLLKKREQTSGVTISYSPSITDKLYPNNTNFLQSTPLKNNLEHLLKGTHIAIRTIGPVYCLLEKKEEKKKSKPLVAEVRKKSIKLPYLPNQIEPVDIKSDFVSMDLPLLLPNPDITPHIIHPKRLRWTVRTNMLLLITGSINMGVSHSINRQWSVGGEISYNPWSYGSARIRHLLIRPEFRYWICDNNSGHFLNGNIQYTRYNIGGLPKSLLFSEETQKYRFQGSVAGLGMGYGYSWILTNRLNLELEIGLGILYNTYTKYPCTNCGTALNEGSKILLAPNKLALNIVYILK